MQENNILLAQASWEKYEDEEKKLIYSYTIKNKLNDEI